MTTKNLQSIAEAIDEDASGFVTIGEMNAFTEDPHRPKDWRSVPSLRVEAASDILITAYCCGLHIGLPVSTMHTVLAFVADLTEGLVRMETSAINLY